MLEPLYRSVLRQDGTVERVDDPVPQGGRATIPSDWSSLLGDRFGGCVVYRRRFGRPTDLGNVARVELQIDAVDAWADVSLNDQSLGRCRYGAAAQFDVLALLLPRNELAITIEKPSADPNAPPLPQHELPGGLIGEVRLAIFALP
jgi:hypothetical protein